MRTRNILPAVLSIPTILAAPAIAAATPAAPDDSLAQCAPLAIGIDGAGSQSQHDLGNKTFIDSELARYQATGMQTKRIDYPADMTNTGEAQGEKAVVDATNAYYKRCPKGRVVIIGYSEGALVAGTAGQSLEAAGSHTDSTRVVMYADPDNGNGMGSARTGKDLPNTVRYSHEWDGVANLGNPIADPIHGLQEIYGYGTGQHAYTPGQADNLAPGNYIIPTPRPITALPANSPAWLLAIMAPFAPDAQKIKTQVGK